jgi:F0F1-type ATP synthase membrane subunit b/b'
MIKNPELWIFLSFIAFIISVFIPAKKMLLAVINNKIKTAQQEINSVLEAKKIAEEELLKTEQKYLEIKKDCENIITTTNAMISRIKNKTEQELLDIDNKREKLIKEIIDEKFIIEKERLKQLLIDSAFQQVMHEVTTNNITNINISDIIIKNKSILDQLISSR